MWHDAHAAGYRTALFSAEDINYAFFASYLLEGEGPDHALTAAEFRARGAAATVARSSAPRGSLVHQVPFAVSVLSGLARSTADLMSLRSCTRALLATPLNRSIGSDISRATTPWGLVS